VPDRVDAGRATPAVVRVRPGDSLWQVARRLLADGAADVDGQPGDAAVDRMWRRRAATNADRIGPDPDLIFPGTLLRVPETGRALGKDHR
jgi:nucleoid-associated protein YgaU